MTILAPVKKRSFSYSFPLIENRIQARIERCKGAEPVVKDGQLAEEVCVLMDEPEMHLHPNLQGKLLDYLRNLAVREHVQFILATHSPTIVEQATSSELFLLRPSEMVGAEANQLSRIATDDEKLYLMREIFGSTSNITAMRNILVVEGQKADESSSRAADERILSFLSDRFAQLTIRSGGSKVQCMTLAKSLAEILSNDLSPNLQAYSLVDRDLDAGDPEDPNTQYLPVSMIENLLVDPEIIWNAIVTVRHKAAFDEQADVECALDELLDALLDHESDRRIKAGVGFHSFRLRDPVATAAKQAADHIGKVEDAVSEAAITRLRQEAEAELAKLAEEYKRRENYDGKKILDEFYRRHLHGTGMSKEIFLYRCAVVCRHSKSCQRVRR